MPTSSGTQGKNGTQDSYLKRYYRTLPDEKRKMIEKSLVNENNDPLPVCHLEESHVDVSSQAAEPVNEIIQHKYKAEDEDSAHMGPREPSTKKSSTCIVL